MENVVETTLIALGLGLLVGLQRQRVDSRLAGLRTFALVTVLGTVTALVSQHFGPWLVAMGFVGVIALAVIGNVIKYRAGIVDPGQTTEAAMLLMYMIGAYLTVGSRPLAVALGAAVAVLLHWKEPLHRFVARIGEPDFRAIMVFVLLSLVILPVLPDRTFGPYNVLNPREIWLMVVLIAGIGLAGYLAFKLWGEDAGTLLGGALGGLVSSTATTVSYARRAATMPAAADAAALVIMIASGLAFVRVAVEISVVAPAFLPVAGPRLAVPAVATALLVAVLWFRDRDDRDGVPAPSNPTELKAALVFGAIYAGVLLAVAAARDLVGDRGLYTVAVISGLTDVDAITLSTSNLVSADRLDEDTGWRIILVAALANLVFKGGIVAFLGAAALLRRIALPFGFVLAAGISVLIFG